MGERRCKRRAPGVTASRGRALPSQVRRFPSHSSRGPKARKTFRPHGPVDPWGWMLPRTPHSSRDPQHPAWLGTPRSTPSRRSWRAGRTSNPHPFLLRRPRPSKGRLRRPRRSWARLPLSRDRGHRAPLPAEAAFPTHLASSPRPRGHERMGSQATTQRELRASLPGGRRIAVLESG